MFSHTSSEKSPWIIVDANSKTEARLTAMLHVIRKFGAEDYVPLTGIDVVKKYNLEINGVVFDDLSSLQYTTLQELIEN